MNAPVDLPDRLIPTRPNDAACDIAIIGSGFSGLAMGIRLKQAGVDDFLIFEKAGSVGGTWRDNHYPGCACDVQSHLYSFSFAPNPSWSRMFSPQPEIRRYLEHSAETFGLIGLFVGPALMTVLTMLWAEWIA